MNRPILIEHAVPLRRQRALERERGIETLAILLEIDDAQPVRSLDSPFVGLELPDDHAEQRRLPRSVGTEDAEAGAGGEEEVEVGEEIAHAEIPADEKPLGLALAGVEVDLRRGHSGAVTTLVELFDQLSGGLDASFGLGGSRLGTTAQPVDLLSHKVGQSLLIGGFVSQQLIALLEKFAVGSLRLK